MKIGYDMSLLERAIELLENKGSLPTSYKSHKLVGILQNIASAT